MESAQINNKLEIHFTQTDNSDRDYKENKKRFKDLFCLLCIEISGYKSLHQDCCLFENFYFPVKKVFQNIILVLASYFLLLVSCFSISSTIITFLILSLG